MRARGMGANVIVIEIDPVKALEAVMDGFLVMESLEAARIGDIFITLTGNISVLRKEHFELMKDGAIVANSGHFNVEIDIPDLAAMSRGVKHIRSEIDQYVMADGRKINLLGRRPVDQPPPPPRATLRGCHGHEFRQSGPLRSEYSGPPGQGEAGEERSIRLPRRSTGKSPAEARIDRGEGRQADRQAEEVPLQLGDGHLTRLRCAITPADPRSRAAHWRIQQVSCSDRSSPSTSAPLQRRTRNETFSRAFPRACAPRNPRAELVTATALSELIADAGGTACPDPSQRARVAPAMPVRSCIRPVLLRKPRVRLLINHYHFDFSVNR